MILSQVTLRLWKGEPRCGHCFRVIQPSQEHFRPFPFKRDPLISPHLFILSGFVFRVYFQPFPWWSKETFFVKAVNFDCRLSTKSLQTRAFQIGDQVQVGEENADPR